MCNVVVSSVWIGAAPKGSAPGPEKTLKRNVSQTFVSGPSNAKKTKGSYSVYSFYF